MPCLIAWVLARRASQLTRQVNSRWIGSFGSPGYGELDSVAWQCSQESRLPLLQVAGSLRGALLLR